MNGQDKIPPKHHWEDCDPEGVFIEKLMCHCGMIFPISDYALKILLPIYNCTDMNGAIKLAKCILPKVKNIKVYVAGYLDVEYRKSASNKWECLSYGGGKYISKEMHEVNKASLHKEEIQKNSKILPFKLLH